MASQGPPALLDASSKEYAICLDDIQAAHRRIQFAVHRTPLLTCDSIRAATGLEELFFKVEALQKSGSFKVRGAVNAVLSLSSEDAAKGVVTHSSGNHAQAVAVAARLRGIDAHIVMPSNAPAVKKAAVLGYGATVSECEPTNAAREAAAAAVVADTGATFLHPSNEPKVMAGQGTMALELLEQIPQVRTQAAKQRAGLEQALAAIHCTVSLPVIAERPPGAPVVDAVVVPVGGGGMLSGIAVAVASLDPRIRVIAAEPAGAADAAASKAAGSLQGHATPPLTIADGLRTCLGSNTWPVVRDLVERIILVPEEAIAACTAMVWTRAKIAIEPSAGVGVAALLSEEFKALQGISSAAVILCGGNADIGTPATPGPILPSSHSNPGATGQ